MSAEETLIQIRKNKHQELNKGIYPLPGFSVPCYNLRSIFEICGKDNDGNRNDYFKTTLDPTVAKLNDDYNEWSLRGRIVAFRKSGSITFLKIKDESGDMQLIASRNVLSDYDRLRLLDLGDIIEVRGWPVYSKTGEESLLLVSWNILTKSHRPPPEKFNGINDQELVYRKRYLDLMSNEESRARFQTRSEIIRIIRKFMQHEKFMEVETSTLNIVSSGANAKPFVTHHNALDTDMYLRIAPELYLKRLLVGGFERVFEIGRNYRNEGTSTRHNPEFTMMESYQAYGCFPELLDFTQELLKFIDKELSTDEYSIHDTQYMIWKAKRTFTFKEFKTMSMKGAVHLALAKIGAEPSEDFSSIKIIDKSKTRLDEINFHAMWNEIEKCTSVGQKIGVMFEHLAEPYLTQDYRSADGQYSCPVFITDYPKDLCPLARSNDKNSDFCDRFELFVDGRELANAFQELNDPDEQAARFKEQQEINEKDPMGYDADYVEALEYGMPPAIGFGMGIDRLVMLLTNAETIKDVILFPTLKPLK